MDNTTSNYTSNSRPEYQPYSSQQQQEQQQEDLKSVALPPAAKSSFTRRITSGMSVSASGGGDIGGGSSNGGLYYTVLASSQSAGASGRDDMDLTSSSQFGRLSRSDSVVSADSRTWLPVMGAVGGEEEETDSSPDVVSHGKRGGNHQKTADEDDDDGGDQSTTSITKTTTSKRRHPAPVPFNFEDSPAPSSASYSKSHFSPMFLRKHHHHHRRGTSSSSSTSHAHLLSPYTPSTTAVAGNNTPWRSPPPGYYFAAGGHDGGAGSAAYTAPPRATMGSPATHWRSTTIPSSRRSGRQMKKKKKKKKKKWYTWRPAWIMYVFLLFGILCAVGHHIFYATLDGQIADRQLEMLRYGAVLAFATKAGLVAAVIVAFRQRIWLTVRSRLLSVGALDSLFAATDDVTALWNWEVYRAATVAMALAVFVWLAPLVIIFTSNSLTVEMYLNTVNTTCPNVRTLNFEKESLEDWRDPTIIDDLIGQSAAIWNATMTSEHFGQGQDQDENAFDYYTSYSPTMEMTVTVAAFTQQTLARRGVVEDICGAGWNCSYTINFTAPGYKCEEVSKGVDAKLGKFGDHDPPRDFGIDLLLPKGKYSYHASAMGGEYAASQVSPVGEGGMPADLKPPFPKNLGAFRTEPIIWVGYVEKLVGMDEVPTNRSVPGWDEAFVPHVFACEHYETEYTVHLSHTSSGQVVNIMDRRYLGRVVDTKWLQDEINPSPHDKDDENQQEPPKNNRTTDGTNDPTVAFPESNYVFPQQVERYRRVAAYHSIGKLVRQFIEGTLESENVLNPIGITAALQTKLLDPRQKWFPFPDLQDRLQSLYDDVIVSMLAEPRFISVVWAANPDIISGAVPDSSPDGEQSRYPCERSRSEIRYKYHARDLWIVYGLALCLALSAIVVGTMAVLANKGVLHDTRFSNIVAATRGPALDRLGWASGHSDAASGGGGDGAVADLPRDVKNVKVGYGIVPLPGAEDQLHDRRNSSYGSEQSPQYRRQQSHGEDDTQVLGPMWDVGEVRYGFGLEGHVRQLLRSDGRGFRSRSRSGLS